jgi:hypothetical protein
MCFTHVLLSWPETQSFSSRIHCPLSTKTNNNWLQALLKQHWLLTLSPILPMLSLLLPVKLLSPLLPLLLKGSIASIHALIQVLVFALLSSKGLRVRRQLLLSIRPQLEKLSGQSHFPISTTKGLSKCLRCFAVILKEER